uniref:Uncharacterized protein n=1 Tax=Knipowitschia caucasica TaxID=637954 RepID=A0AAV2KPB5_KNICA
MPGLEPGVSLLLLPFLLTHCGSSITPRISFPLGSSSRGLTWFHLQNVRNYSTLLLSPDQRTLYAGAQDAVLELDVSPKDSIQLIRKLEWSPTKKDTEQCSMKGKKVVSMFVHRLVLVFGPPLLSSSLTSSDLLSPHM